MNHPKLIIAIFLLIAVCITKIHAQDTIKKETTNTVFSAIDKPPMYPGGYPAFGTYIKNNLRYPEVAKILGLNGRVIVSFIVEADGRISTVKPVTCMGAGCESEAARVIEMSKPWLPGIQNEKPVRVQYAIPINFGLSNVTDKIRLNDLKNTNYGFVFFIKGKTYSIDDVKAIIGKSFDPRDIIDAEPYDNKDYIMPGKKAVYLVVINSDGINIPN